MPKRRANGEGNIRKRKDGRWEGRYTVGHDPETGKAIIKNVLGKTQAEVKEKLKKAIEENVGIDYGKAKTYTVGSWLEVWMENYAKVKLRPSTFKTSQGFLKNHIKPQIGSIPLAELTSLDLQRLYKHLLDGGRVDRIEVKKKPKGLAPKTVRNIHQMIGSAYNLAMEQKLVTRNPTQGCALPKVEHKEMKTLTADQLGAFFQEARDSGVYELYYLDLATGLRRGELLGLKWTDIDLDRGVLKIQRAISRQNGKVVEAPLKTKNAYRTLPLSVDAISVLKMQKCKVGNSEWVFPSPTGGPMSPDSVLHMLQRVLKRAGCPASDSTISVTPSRRWRSRTAWTSRPSAVCWATTQQGSRWTHTPTSPPTRSSKRRKRWGTSSPVLSDGFRYPLPLGSAFGSEKGGTPKMGTYEKQKSSKSDDFEDFWYAVRDSNPRPSGP